MDDVKRLGYPVLIIFLSAFIVKLVNTYFYSNFTAMLLTIITVSALFLIGTSLNKSRKRRNPAVLKKVLAIIIVLFLVLMQLGLFEIAVVSEVLFFFGVNSFFINMIYIFCGFLFVD